MSRHSLEVSLHYLASCKIFGIILQTRCTASDPVMLLLVGPHAL